MEQRPEDRMVSFTLPAWYLQGFIWLMRYGLVCSYDAPIQDYKFRQIAEQWCEEQEKYLMRIYGWKN